MAFRQFERTSLQLSMGTLLSCKDVRRWHMPTP